MPTTDMAAHCICTIIQLTGWIFRLFLVSALRNTAVVNTFVQISLFSCISISVREILKEGLVGHLLSVFKVLTHTANLLVNILNSRHVQSVGFIFSFPFFKRKLKRFGFDVRKFLFSVFCKCSLSLSICKMGIILLS